MLTFDQLRKYLLVFLAATLSSTVVLKFAEIQYLELIFAVDFLLLLGMFARGGLQVRIYRPFLEIGKSYALFLALAFLLSFFALNQDFSSSLNDSLFKKPVVVTVARIGELFLDVFYMLYLANLYREDEKICIFGAKTYYWAGIAGCVYSFATYPLNVLYGLSLGTYGDIHRLRGFNNEGGSFGLYLVSVCLLAFMMYRRNWLSKRQFQFGMAILIAGIIGSQSKSAFSAMALLGLIVLMWFYHGWKRWTLIAGMLAGLVAVGSILNFQALIDTYIRGSETYQEMSNLRPDDGNYVMGRVAGAVLAPRMIAARPLLGIGWGNYPLVRDDRNYRQGTAFTMNSTDAPGLGIVDYIVELGIPLWVYLTWIELKPVFMLRRRGADLYLVSLALVMPVSNWAGSHLNLVHLWIVLAFALGLGYQTRSREILVAEPVSA
jgi:O-Antigen ligase